MDTAAMNSSVQHPIARARGPELALCNTILIKLMQNSQVTFASMQGHAGVLMLNETRQALSPRELNAHNRVMCTLCARVER